MVHARLIGLLLALLVSPAAAQQQVSGVVTSQGTVNISGLIATGNIFQEVLPKLSGGTNTQRQSLTIQNNNISSDNCWVYVGTIANATAAASILLSPGQAYTRYWPHVPSDQISVTCATAADSFYADYQ